MHTKLCRRIWIWSCKRNGWSWNWKKLHEEPQVPNYGRKGNGIMLKEGLVIIEPMINLGTKRIKQHSDGWTIITADKKCSAHFEHTVVVRKGRAEVLSSFEEIEKRINK